MCCRSMGHHYGCSCGCHESWDRHHGGHHMGRHYGDSCGCHESSGRHHGGHDMDQHQGDSCGCHESFHSWPRRIWTQKEQISYLEQYLADLREEVKAVEERIAALPGENE